MLAEYRPAPGCGREGRGREAEPGDGAPDLRHQRVGPGPRAAPVSNAYDTSRGNTTDRQRRKLWLLETYAADVFLVLDEWSETPRSISRRNIGLYLPHEIIPCCRCYCCGKLLTYETLTVDRIIPGKLGGKYRRDNIRPSCKSCANKQGAELRAQKRN